MWNFVKNSLNQSEKIENTSFIIIITILLMTQTNAINDNNESNTTRPNEPIYSNIYVKLVYTCTFNNYNLNMNVSVRDFIQNIKNSVYNDPILNITPDTPIEIVESGQGSKNMKAEDAPALVESDDIIGNKYKRTPAFYVRICTST